MYSFQTGAGKRKNKQTIRILSVVIFVLVIGGCDVFLHPRFRREPHN